LEWFVKNPSCEEVEFEKYGYMPEEPCEYKIIFLKEEPKQENCCTPVGQIKRYVDCKGCDRKPKQETLEETAEWLNKKFNGKGVEVKIINWGKNEMYNYNPTKLLEEYSKWKAERICSHDYILTSEHYHRIIKCTKCNNIQPI
jgi:hypothetical protein